MRKSEKVFLTLMLLLLLYGLFGCGKTHEQAVDDIQSVSISCGHMDYSHSYSFYIRKAENKWLFDAEFAADAESSRVEFENCHVAEKDVKELLNLVRDREVIKKLYRVKRPKTKVYVSDETTYYTSLLFADGEKIGASARISQDLETYFYRLAKKYTNIISETN